jgi:hypothetical protein
VTSALRCRARQDDPPNQWPGGGPPFPGSRRPVIGLVETVVGIADLGAAEETVADIAVQRPPFAETFRQVRVRDEVAAEGDQVGVASLKNGFRRLRREAACGDDGALEVLAQLLRRDRVRILAAIVIVAGDARFDQVQVRELELRKLLGGIAEQTSVASFKMRNRFSNEPP